MPVQRHYFANSRIPRYHSVRLDAVHYCEREIELSAKRKRRSFFDRNGEPEDTTQKRLQLFSRTVRETDHLAYIVQNLKMPYMTRETCKADLARTVSVLRHLQYVDLPEGFYRDDSSTNTLKQELQSRCPDIRKMAYLAGSEESFTMLAHTRQWQNLEILELSGVRVAPDTLLYVLASFPALHEVKLGKLPALDDTIFAPNNSLPPFPSLVTLVIEDAPTITSTGLISYLSRDDARESLTELRLSHTGVLPSTLHEVLYAAPYLGTLTINETVSRSFPITAVPLLASRSLCTLHYEILPATNSPNPPSETYYNYLATSLLSGSLPSLMELYAFSPSLPDLLLFAPAAPFAAASTAHKPSRFSAYSVASTSSSIYSVQAPTFDSLSHSGIISPLSLYTKFASAPELEWSFTHIEPPNPKNGRRGSATTTRPLSLVANEGSPNNSSWGSKGRDSTLVGNGFGGFLAVPNDDGGGRSGFPHGHTRKASNKGNQWMG